jgi:hypothetical protein
MVALARNLTRPTALVPVAAVAPGTVPVVAVRVVPVEVAACTAAAVAAVVGMVL